MCVHFTLIETNYIFLNQFYFFALYGFTSVLVHYLIYGILVVYANQPLVISNPREPYKLGTRRELAFDSGSGLPSEHPGHILVHHKTEILKDNYYREEYRTTN